MEFDWRKTAAYRLSLLTTLHAQTTRASSAVVDRQRITPKAIWPEAFSLTC
jgi:hypothetical protein